MSKPVKVVVTVVLTLVILGNPEGSASLLRDAWDAAAVFFTSLTR